MKTGINQKFDKKLSLAQTTDHFGRNLLEIELIASLSGS